MAGNWEQVGCPTQRNNRRCCGAMKLLDVEQTTLAPILGYDSNRNTEVFECPICGEKYKRTWKWEKVNE